jgi:oxygen-independent coproporphyrinogen-3 oxidase
LSDARAGLYLHVPFCRRVCPYCDFAVRTGDEARRRAFVDDLIAEIALNANCVLEFDTVYFGGGTPSSLAAADLERIVRAARDGLRLARDTEIFLEANPEDVSLETTAAWKGAGVEFLSLGIQSFDREELRFLGRQHDADTGLRAVETALGAGFDTVSIDLIYGLPRQRLTTWKRQLQLAAGSGAQHLSCYQLTIHRGTRFGLLDKRGQLEQMPSHEQGGMFYETHRRLADAGFAGYEVSNFAHRERHRSAHNMKYWDHTPYLGLGPSAHSFDGRRRWWNLRRTDPWQERIRAGRRPIDGQEVLRPAQIALESLMTGLRTYAGVDLARLRSVCGVDALERNRELVLRLTAEGLLRLRSERLVPTLEGLAVADSLAPMFDLGD